MNSLKQNKKKTFRFTFAINIPLNCFVVARTNENRKKNVARRNQ